MLTNCKLPSGRSPISMDRKSVILNIDCMYYIIWWRLLLFFLPDREVVYDIQMTIWVRSPIDCLSTSGQLIIARDYSICICIDQDSLLDIGPEWLSLKIENESIPKVVRLTKILTHVSSEVHANSRIRKLKKTNRSMRAINKVPDC